MENIVDRIRDLCLKNHTSITKLEAELGYANGTIGKWAKGKRTPPLEKVMAIAEKLHTTTEYLYQGKTKKPSIPEGGGIGPAKQELIELIKAGSDENATLLLEMMKRMK